MGGMMGGGGGAQTKQENLPGVRQAMQGATDSMVPSYFGDRDKGYYQMLQDLTQQLSTIGNQTREQFQQGSANAASLPAGQADVQLMEKNIQDMKDKAEQGQMQSYMSQSWKGVMNQLSELAGTGQESKTTVNTGNAALRQGGSLVSGIGSAWLGSGLGSK